MVFSEEIKEGCVTETNRIYDRIVGIAKQKGMSVNQVEKQAGVSIGSTCKWNEISPTVRNLKKVANCLDVPVEKLLE